MKAPPKLIRMYSQSSGSNSPFFFPLIVFLISPFLLTSELQEFYDDFNKQVAEWVPMTTTVSGNDFFYQSIIYPSLTSLLICCYRKGSDCVQLQRLIGGIYSRLWADNIKGSRTKCNSSLTELWKSKFRVEEKVESGKYASLDDYYKDVEKVKDEYLNNSEVIVVVFISFLYSFPPSFTEAIHFLYGRSFLLLDKWNYETRNTSIVYPIHPTQIQR